jgi:hypothetical protein
MTRVMSPMPEDLTDHMERLITAMFSCCDENQVMDDVDLRYELRSVYVGIEHMKKEDTDRSTMLLFICWNLFMNA